MVTIRRVHGLRVVIFTDGHEPAHVHVFGDGHARINPVGPDGEPELVRAEGMKRNEVRRAMAFVIEHQAACPARCRDTHG